MDVIAKLSCKFRHIFQMHLIRGLLSGFTGGFRIVNHLYLPYISCAFFREPLDSEGNAGHSLRTV